MNIFPPPLSGLGLLNFLAVPLGLWQYRLVVQRRFPFNGLAMIAICCCSADLSCFGAWLLGYSLPDDASYHAKIFLSLLPVPLAMLIAVAGVKYREPPEYSMWAPKYRLDNNKDVASLVLSIPMYFASAWVSKFATGNDCGTAECVALQTTFGTSEFIYGILTATTVAATYIWVFVAVLVYSFFKQSRLQENKVNE